MYIQLLLLVQIYEGQFAFGKMEGQGRYLFGNGSEYRGSFEKDLMQGIGTCKYANGMLYRGEFNADRRHGKGILWFPPPPSIITAVSSPVPATSKATGKGLPSLKAPSSTSSGIGSGSSKKTSRPPVTLTPVKSILLEQDLDLTWEGALLLEGGSCYEGDFEEGFMHGQGKYRYAR